MKIKLIKVLGSINFFVQGMLLFFYLHSTNKLFFPALLLPIAVIIVLIGSVFLFRFYIITLKLNIVGLEEGILISYVTKEITAAVDLKKGFYLFETPKRLVVQGDQKNIILVDKRINNFEQLKSSIEEYL